MKTAGALGFRIRRRFKPTLHVLKRRVLRGYSAQSPCLFDALQQVQSSGFSERADEQRRREYASRLRQVEQFFRVSVLDAINASWSSAEHSDRQSRHVKEEVHRHRSQTALLANPC